MKRLAISITLALGFMHCTGELPLSDLVNNTITLKVLGTYESNNPYGAGFNNASSTTTLWKDDVITGGSITGTTLTLTSPSMYNFATQIKTSDIKYYIDLAEIRIAQGQGKSSSQSISDYWAQFAISRQLMCSTYDSADGRGLTNCSDSAGIDRLNSFFSGGFTYPAVDIPSGSFNHMGIYFRRFATYPAARFYGDGNYYNGATYVTNGDANTATQAMTTAFDNRTIYGLDIEGLLQNAYNGSNTEPMLFPLQRKDLALNISNDHEPYIMEVRIFILNNMMVHVIQNAGNTADPTDITNSHFIYVAPSDWNVNHAFSDLTNNNRQGGALIFTARTYQPAKVGSIQINGGTATTTNMSYYVAVPSGSTFTPTTALPYAATAAATTATITNLPPGTYDIYRTCDIKYCTSSSTAGTCDNPQTGKDGFPETAVLCTGTATVTTGTTTNYTAACGVIAGCI